MRCALIFLMLPLLVLCEQYDGIPFEQFDKKSQVLVEGLIQKNVQKLRNAPGTELGNYWKLEIVVVPCDGMGSNGAIIYEYFEEANRTFELRSCLKDLTNFCIDYKLNSIYGYTQNDHNGTYNVKIICKEKLIFRSHAVSMENPSAPPNAAVWPEHLFAICTGIHWWWWIRVLFAIIYIIIFVTTCLIFLAFFLFNGVLIYLHLFCRIPPEEMEPIRELDAESNLKAKAEIDKGLKFEPEFQSNVVDDDED